MSESAPIVVSAVILRDSRGRVLAVRKRDTQVYMFPGGKPELRETARDAATREVEEELGIQLDQELLSHLGTFSCAAANEPGRTILAEVFTYADTIAVARAAREIAELAWVCPNNPEVPLAPLLSDHVFPRLDSDC